MPTTNLTLYHGMASTCSKKVRMCLYEKGVAFESRLLDLQKFEQHSSDYLAINPNGVVPTLVHEGRSVTESSVIVDYIDDVFAQNPLKPADPYDRAQMRLWLKYSDDVAYKAVYAPTWQALRHRAEEGLSGGKLSETLSSIPTAERRDRWEKMAKGGFTDAEIEAAYALMRTCLAKVDAQIRITPWLAGPTFSLADLAMLPFVDRMSNLRPEFLEGQKLVAMRDWLARSKQRPSFDRAFAFRDDPRAAELPNI
jgi:glutathione S-transferase